MRILLLLVSAIILIMAFSTLFTQRHYLEYHILECSKKETIEAAKKCLNRTMPSK